MPLLMEKEGMSLPFNPNVFIEEGDLQYEEDILRNSYVIKSWLRYIEHKKKDKALPTVINLIYERALKELPGSYKLWHEYLRLRIDQMKGCCITNPGYESVNNAFERSLVFMHKMPRIWLDYCKFLQSQGLITRTRKTFDKSLRALPITQHARIWPKYLEFVQKFNIPETAVRIHRRYIKLEPQNMEDFVQFLIASGRLDEAANRIIDMINNDDFVSKEGKPKHTMWNELTDLVCRNPDGIVSLRKRIEPIIRQGIKRYTDQIGLLWNSLADYYIRSGLFERARDIYEEAIQTVLTVRDFTQVFDAYAQFEESMISAKMESTAEVGPTKDDDVELELRLARLEDLIERRPLLLNSVLLRQNPHNVHEWLKRVSLYEGNPIEQISTFTEAVQTVDPQLATGKLHTLWVEFAKFYEKAEQFDDARAIFQRATEVRFKHVDDLASVWCERAELELRQENHEEAVKLMHRATIIPPVKVDYHDSSEPVQKRLYKSLKLWSLYADLEESLGTFQTCKAVYDCIIDLRIATPQIVMNYAMFLEENNYYEEAFKVYEKGIALFRWPNVFDIWNTYLNKFIKRFEGSKLERARDLFEQCLENVPAKFSKSLYLKYAKLEEDYGMARHAMAVYDRATKAVLPEEQYEMFNIYIKRAAELYGVTYTRSIYQRAIEVLQDQQAREVCMRFADLERKLGEIDRARTIYSYCSQMCDPRMTADFWKTWQDFEVRHGNEDTIRELLRIRRSVQATYNTQVNFMSAQMLASAQISAAEAKEAAKEQAEGGRGDSMKSLEARARQMAEESLKAAKSADSNIKFVRSDTGEEASAQQQGETVMVMSRKNPDEIDIDDDDDEEAEDTKGEADPQSPEDESTAAAARKRKAAPVPVHEVGIEEQAIPLEVYGGLKKDDDDVS